MGYDRYDRNAGSQGDHEGAREPFDADRSRERGDGRYAGHYGDNERGASQQRTGRGDYGNARYGQREQQAGRGFENRLYGGGRPYEGSYARDGQRFGEPERGQRDYYRPSEDRDRERGGQRYGRQPEGYDYEERGFLARAGDEVRSWFGDDDAERRREADTRYDERSYAAGSYGRDDDYHQWRRGQIDALDRDYQEYRQENRARFENEFGTWRTERQSQRGSLSRVTEHMDVVGSDGAHIGKVDKVRGDRIVLTRNDQDAGGRHHSIPSRWIESVDDKVTVRKTADEAKAHWRDEETSQALFGEKGNGRAAGRDDAATGGPGGLDRSFSGTY